MVEWKKRVERTSWPPRKSVEEIFNTDVFLVAMDGPGILDRRKAFCLSFSLAEIKLGQCLSTVQRRVYLILKSYLYGIFQKRYMELYSVMKLKTDFLKAAFFWVCESGKSAMWTENNTIDAVKTVLKFLLLCIQEKKLSHYFINSNLLAELEDLDGSILQRCIREVLNNPVNSISEFRFIKTDSKNHKWKFLLMAVTERYHIESEDGARLQHLNNLEDGLIDVLRGFNDSPRDAIRRAPIKEAILKAFDIFLEYERQKEITNGALNVSTGGKATRNTTNYVPRENVTAITGGGYLSVNSQEANDRMNLLLGFGSMIAGGSEFIANIGGREGVQAVLEQSTGQDTDHASELRNAIDSYLSCNDDKEDSMALQLKQKRAAYFVGRKEK